MAERKIERMDAAEFLEWATRQEGTYELVDGIPRAIAGARMGHDRVVVNGVSAFLRHLRGTPCEPFTEAVGVQIPNGNIRRPDITVDCGERHDDLLYADRPVLVVEVLSRSTMDYDLLVKILDYKSHPSIRHILFVKPDDYAAILHSRTADGPWTDASLIGADTIVDLTALGIAFPLAELYPPRS